MENFSKQTSTRAYDNNNNDYIIIIIMKMMIIILRRCRGKELFRLFVVVYIFIILLRKPNKSF